MKINNIEQFVSSVDDFDTISKSEMIDFFCYYLLTFQSKQTVKPKDIAKCFVDLSIPTYANIPQYLVDNAKKTRAKQKYIRHKDTSYSLTRERSEEVSKKVILDFPKVHISSTLRHLLVSINNPSERVFLEEAVKTFEVDAYRAAILMVWLLTLDHLFEYILANKLQDFITALRRANINKSIHTKDDFGDIKESQFIEVCRSANIISNDVRKILDTKLGIRNSFAHPSSIHLPKSKALEFIEDLVINVIKKY